MFRQTIKNHWVEICIILISSTLYVTLANAPFKAKPFGDFDFHLETKRIAGSIWGNQNNGTITISKAPGPVLFFVMPYLAAGPQADDNDYWLAAIIWSGFFMTAGLILIYRACINFGFPLAGKIIVLLGLCLPLHLYYSLGILAEGLAFFGCCLAVYGFSSDNGPSLKSKILYALGLLLIILARPNAAIIPALGLGIYVILLLKIKDHDLKKYFKKYSVLFLSVIVVFLLIVAGVKQFTTAKSSHENYFLHVAQHGRYQFRDETWDWRFWDDTTRKGSEDYENCSVTIRTLDSLSASGQGSYKEVYSQWLVNDLLEHPIVFIKQFFIRILYGHTLMVNSVQPDTFRLGPLRAPVAYYVVMGLLNLVNFTIILLAVFFILKKNNRLTFLPLALIWLGLIFFSAVVYMEQRYLFPARPVILLFASLQLAYLVEKYKKRLSFNPNS